MLVLFGKALAAAPPLSTRSNETPPPFNVQGEFVTLVGIDINPALFPRSLFTYSALLLLWFLFTTVELWSLACCLEEFPSYAIVYFKANYFEIASLSYIGHLIHSLNATNCLNKSNL